MTADAGMVISQELTILRMTLRFNAAIPRARPTPMTEPTRVWLVDTGRPSLEQTRTVVAVANSAEKPRDGVMEVIFLPMVSMTRYPQVPRPTTIPAPPNARTHMGTGTFMARSPFLNTDTMAAKGPMALATSLAPWANAT